MTIDSINGTQMAGGAGQTGTTDGMDRDTFLKLLVTQLSNQDPLQPTEPTEFVSQLAEFTALEQMSGVREGMDLMLISQTAATSAQVVEFVGKEITFEDNRVAWSGVGSQPLGFELASDATEVEVQVKDASGRIVRTAVLGPMEEGVQTVSFDGLDDNLNPLAAGEYTFEVWARDSQGDSVAAATRDRALVTGVTFERGYPELLVADGRTVLLGQVLQVHGAGTAAPEPGDLPLPTPEFPPILDTGEAVFLPQPEIPAFNAPIPFPTPK
jgi:flagellar basal-body rod modification protein FlgD